MSIDFDSIAESYLGCFEVWQLKKVADEGIDLAVLKDWVVSECEEVFSEDDFRELNSSIMSLAEYLLEEAKREAKREAAYELTSSIDNTINGYCSCLEDHELTAIFAEYASRYLPNKFN